LLYLSVRIKQLGFHWTDSYESLYLSIFRKSVKKIKDFLESYNNNGYLTRRRTCIFNNIVPNSYNKKCIEKIITDTLCSTRSFRNHCRLIDNVGKCCRDRQATDDNIIRRMRIAWRISKAIIRTRIHYHVKEGLDLFPVPCILKI
jgi:hypothetical protein